MYPSNMKEIAGKRIEEYYDNEDIAHAIEYVYVSNAGIPSIIPSKESIPYLDRSRIFIVEYHKGSTVAVRI